MLEWVFNQTPIPHVISGQMGGQRTLTVGDRGTFKVVWHLASDLKTLKCLYNCNRGAMTLPCLYCMEPAKTLDHKWWTKPPNRHLLDKNFKPVFDIPLSNVHICTMHALCRVVEKLINLYIGFVWKIKNQSERRKGIIAIEDALSSMQLHGGNVQIEQDQKLSTSEKDLPKKVSVGGVKARRFLSRPAANTTKKRATNHVSRIEYQQWRKLHNAVKDHEAASRNAKSEVWHAIDNIFGMCDKESWSTPDIKVFQAHLLQLKKQFIAAWTENNITHYMVR